MPTKSEVLRFNLEYYRKQAKVLLKAGKGGDSEALLRLRRYLPKQKFGPDQLLPALHDAQFAIANEQGFPSWPRFKAFITESQLDFQGLVDEFIDAAMSDRQRARTILAAHPKIAEGGFYVALVLGDWKKVERVLAETPSIINLKTGPQKCEPLLYVCFSRYANGKSDRAGEMATTARTLLRGGADPNAFLVPEDLPDNPLPCLYAATGLNNNPELALALLEAGANPNDCESLYHSTEHHDLVCMKLLLQHDASPKRTNVLKHMLDREEIEGLKLLLTASADPNETNERGESALHWAVWRGRSAESIELLMLHGADLDIPRNDGRTAYALARLSGQQEIATLLAARGASTDLAAFDQFAGDCANADPQELERLLATRPKGTLPPGNERLLPDFVAEHYTSTVRAFLVAGMPVDARGEAGGTGLHWACWKGYPDLAELLIRHGASLSIEDTEFHATPSGWLHHGSTNYRGQDGNHAQVARVLLATGSPMPGCTTPTGNERVDAVLREHKLFE
jgi:ankyrin repeat protein